MGILDGKKVLVTGVLTDDSLAFGVARHAQEQGAEVLLSGFGRGLSLTRRTARRLPETPDVIELDVTNDEQLLAAANEVGQRFGRLDGLVHAIGFAPANCLGNGMLAAEWEDVSTALQVSTYSLKALVKAFLPLLETSVSASVVGLDFDASLAWPGYDWMGVAKAALESLARYLARDLGPRGVRVNLVAAGPVRTVAARSIPGFSRFEEVWDTRAPLGWDLADEEHAVGKATVALLSDLFSKTTGEIVHVDGGFHATGA
ncbi:MAG: short-chain dehydrogenase/reductase [Acidimicrobiaceae bacterium]|nr:short-chain dehydrogenase/reductase [Acidimicrobiaceae bacterium]